LQIQGFTNPRILSARDVWQIESKHQTPNTKIYNSVLYEPPAML
jgi:hypothetical protein